MATSGSDLTSDEIIHIKCCICAEENRTREGENYCMTCKDYYCSSCVGIHQKIPHMKGHKILGQGDFKTLGPDGSLPSYPTQRCPQHQLEVVNTYCKDHDDVACGLCVAMNHRSCKNIISIADEVDNLYQQSNLKDAKQELEETKKTMDEFKKTKQSKILELNKALDTEIETVKAFRQELQALLDKMEQEAIQELRREYYRIESALAEEIQDIESLSKSLDEAASWLKKSEGNKAQGFVCVKSSQKLIAKGKEANKITETGTTETVTFTPNQSIKHFLQQNKTLVVCVAKPDNQKYIGKDSLYEVKKQKEIDVKLPSDKNNCYIYVSCITADGFLLLADNNNNNLKRINMSTEKVKDHIEFQLGKPYAVCIISDTEGAVTLSNNSVQFVSLGNKMAVTRSLQMNHTCFGLAHYNGKLFISDSNKTVYIYDMKGKEQHRYTGTASNRHIIVSDSGDRVFVTDYQKGLIVLDGQGNYITTLSDSKLSGCYGVCTESRNIFVSGVSSYNIVQFGHDLKILGELAKLEQPLGLCFDHKMFRLIAALYNSNKIVVYELE